MTPMMQQYIATKEQYKDCILFYRLGDFYEMFFDDAIVVSKELELTLTGKSCGLEERAPMCGVPYHSVEGYLNKLISDWFDRNLKSPSDVQSYLLDEKNKSKNIKELAKKTGYNNYEQRNYDNLDSLYANQ